MEEEEEQQGEDGSNLKIVKREPSLISTWNFEKICVASRSGLDFGVTPVFFWPALPVSKVGRRLSLALLAEFIEIDLQVEGLLGLLLVFDGGSGLGRTVGTRGRSRLGRYFSWAARIRIRFVCRSRGRRLLRWRGDRI